MVIFLIVLAAGITYIGWQLYKTKVASNALPNAGTPVPNSGVATQTPAPAAPFNPLGSVTEALLGGKPVSNGPTYTGPVVDTVDYGSVLDKPNVSYFFPAGIKTFSFPVKGGGRYTLESIPYKDGGYGVGSVSVAGLVNPITGGFCPAFAYQAQNDGVQTVTVNSDKSGLVRFSVV